MLRFGLVFPEGIAFADIKGGASHEWVLISCLFSILERKDMETQRSGSTGQKASVLPTSRLPADLKLLFIPLETNTLKAFNT